MDRAQRMLAELDAEISDAEAVADRARIRVRDLHEARARLRAALGVPDQPKQVSMVGMGSGKSHTMIARITRAQAIYDYLAAHPGSEFGPIARAVYGEDNDDTRHKVRAQIFSLSSQGRIERKKRGEWHVVANSTAAPEQTGEAM